MEQIRRKEAEKQGKKVAPKKKRARGEELLETLEEIKTTQRMQSELLNTLLNTNLVHASFPLVQQAEPYASTSACGLEDALQNVIDTYNRLDHHERPAKLRRVLEQLDPRQRTVMVELGTLFSNLPSSSPLSSFQSPPAPSEESTSDDNEPERIYTSPSPSELENFDPCALLEDF